MPEVLTREDFADRLGDEFHAIAEEGRTLTLTLDDVRTLPRPVDDQGREPFALDFHDASPDHVPQQTVTVEHADLGSFPLFVVPLGPGEHGMRYEAIFT